MSTPPAPKHLAAHARQAEQTAAANPLYRPLKTSTTIRLDADVVAWLRGQGPGWQTRINRILRETMLRALGE